MALKEGEKVTTGGKSGDDVKGKNRYIAANVSIMHSLGKCM